MPYFKFLISFTEIMDILSSQSSLIPIKKYVFFYDVMCRRTLLEGVMIDIQVIYVYAVSAAKVMMCQVRGGDDLE
jgi:hypothetical protein